MKKSVLFLEIFFSIIALLLSSIGYCQTADEYKEVDLAKVSLQKIIEAISDFVTDGTADLGY